MSSPPIGTRPIAYQALAANLRMAISKGEFSNGQRLPTEAELSAHYRVSRQTVRRALQDLVSEGLVFRVRGRGTFATAQPSSGKYLRSFGSIDDLLALSQDTTLETVWPLERKADVDAASRLHLPSDEVMTALFRRFHEAVPFCVTQVYLPLDIGRDVARRNTLPPVGRSSPITVISIVDEVSPQPLLGAHQSITASSVPSAFATLIDADAGQPALRIDRLYFDTAGVPVELAISYFNPDRYSYRLELRRSVRAPNG